LGQRACAPHTHRAQRRGTPQPWWGRADRGTCSRVRVFQHFDDATRLPCALLALEAPVVEAVTGLVTADSKACLPMHAYQSCATCRAFYTFYTLPQHTHSTNSAPTQQMHGTYCAQTQRILSTYSAKTQDRARQGTTRRHGAEQGKARHDRMTRDAPTP